MRMVFAWLRMRWVEASGGKVETAAIRRNLPTFGIAVDRLLGMQIVMGPPGSIGLRMGDFVGKMQDAQMKDLVVNNKFAVSAARIQTLARQVVGGLLWVGQLNFHIDFDLTVLGATICRLAGEVKRTKEFFLRSNRPIRTVGGDDWRFGKRAGSGCCDERREICENFGPFPLRRQTPCLGRWGREIRQVVFNRVL